MRLSKLAFTCGLVAASMLAGTVSSFADTSKKVSASKSDESETVSDAADDADGSEAVSETTDENWKVIVDVDVDEQLVRGSNRLAAALTSALYSEDENLIFSPYSIYTALSMLSHCSSGESSDDAKAVKSALLDALGVSDEIISEEELAAAHANITSVLTTGFTIDESAKFDSDGYTDDSASKFNIANALLVDYGCERSDKFSELEAYLSEYNAEVSFSDLSSSETMDNINSWVDENTNGMIPKLLDQPLDKTTAAALLNAVYFSGCWATPFNESQTDEAVFHGTDGDTRVRMMHTVDTMSYFEDDNFDVVSLYYADGYRMMLYVPHENASIDWTDTDMLEELFSLDPASFETYQVTLAMPRFEQEYSSMLNDALESIGLDTIFEGGFDRISKDELAVSDVIHKAKISIDENGTEAAAATMIALTESAMIVENYAELTIDRPFAYAIINNRENLVVFAGITQDIAE